MTEIYKKPMTKEEHERFLELMGDPSEEDIKRIQEALRKDRQRILDEKYSKHFAEQEDIDMDHAIAAIRKARTGLKSKKQ